MPVSSKRPGRRPGTSNTRDDILASARKLFSVNGIDKTSMRSIAADAGVDPALIHHYFGTKLDLFREVVQLPVDPSVVLQPLREVPVDELGVAIPRLIVALWDSDLGANVLAVFRSALAGADDGLVRVFFREVLVNIIAERVDNPVGSGVLRAEFAITQMAGILVGRYILAIEPLASLTSEQIALTVGPNIQRYLTGELPSITQ
ncbi:TetR/AcrR family transcriptional regulator [Mycobacteroides franklinii]|uniref:DNA-binding transcriptional repressor AcrR n=1 Tax=Mycobacteroides franklinii TaxID=948102 RepID=A0A4R8QY41_9MYCO|nr:TetR/AcrR family transcriptional regulator [Mycobacteroides franklinii]TDZ45244.1 DNA-binding transcriptional repressor AcrR [Mycobacteroides franklinii]TDZ48735.1 DNA-binding transcriptional repressor AcrR [Mycobacteroides franklinii]TDZ58916.1 DNA-binding transcriptional repressor AcrR [Mycobacteroides franklinii]TDZ66430.1 DNA-binding transcriptional repressor AcrR [Mycobacteroides franklinii]TDZ72353.1 DNA-binding transcriptional repressor AcrR [Mycobacteroides franklinii]